MDIGRSLDGEPGRRPRLTLSLRKVLDLASRRSAAEARRGFTPRQWNEGPTRHPFIRTTIQAPPGDRLITPREAAAILDIHVTKITHLVRKGILFGWQTTPGRQGCPLWLSERQVLRYRDDPARLKKRRAYLEGAAPLTPLGQMLTETEAWREDRHLPQLDPAAESRFTERDYGEYFTARQAARVLGITHHALLGLRSRGRLPGWQTPRKGHGGNKWWFFRKDDVYALLADPDYAQRAHRGKVSAAARLQQGRRTGNPVPPTLEELDACIRAAALGRPPCGEWRESGWDWGEIERTALLPALSRDPADP